MSVSVVFPSGLSWFLSFAALRRDDGGRGEGLLLFLFFIKKGAARMMPRPLL